MIITLKFKTSLCARQQNRKISCTYFEKLSFKYISYQSRIVIIKNIPFNTHIEIHMIRAIYDIPYWLAMGPRRGWRRSSYFIFVNWCCHEENYFYYYYYFYFYIIFLAGTFQRALRSVLILVQELRAVAFVRLFFCFPHVEFCVVRFCICAWVLVCFWSEALSIEISSVSVQIQFWNLNQWNTCLTFGHKIDHFGTKS